MKKVYIIPCMGAMRLHGEAILAGSGVIGKTGTNSDIEWGGTDTDGTLDPSVKENVFSDNPFE